MAKKLKKYNKHKEVSEIDKPTTPTPKAIMSVKDISKDKIDHFEKEGKKPYIKSLDEFSFIETSLSKLNRTLSGYFINEKGHKILDSRKDKFVYFLTEKELDIYNRLGVAYRNKIELEKDLFNNLIKSAVLKNKEGLDISKKYLDFGKQL